MRRFYLFLSLLLVALTANFLFSNEKVETKEMTLHDFMEDYVEIAEKKYKKGNKEPLRKMLETIPSLALPEDKEQWEKFTGDALESEKLLSSCKACHTKFKKSYKKSYRKRLVSIPKEILKME